MWALYASASLAVSGHGPYQNGEYVYLGKLGRDLDVAAGQAAARIVMLNFLATVRAVLGSLDHVERVVKLLVMVNSDLTLPTSHSSANGASDLLVGIFGKSGASTEGLPSGWARYRWGSLSRSRDLQVA